MFSGMYGEEEQHPPPDDTPAAAQAMPLPSPAVSSMYSNHRDDPRQATAPQLPAATSLSDTLSSLTPATALTLSKDFSQKNPLFVLLFLTVVGLLLCVIVMQQQYNQPIQEILGKWMFSDKKKGKKKGKKTKEEDEVEAVDSDQSDDSSDEDESGSDSDSDDESDSDASSNDDE
jgi:hypothetical protein